MKRRDRLIEFAMQPVPLRTLLLRKFLKHFPIGSFATRLRVGAVQRVNYAWCMYYAAVEAKALGHKAVTVIELGVAGGNGLLCLCQHRKEIQKELGIEIIVVGFDSGTGLPQSTDHRDLLYAWPTGAYRMDRVALEAHIEGQAQLVLGDVAITVPAWNPAPDAPLGAILFDLDYYTSTVSAFRLFAKENVLPRIWCYFDDVCGGPEEATTDRVGEREAIREFKADPERATRKDHLSPAYTFRGLTPDGWHQHIYLYHRFSHPDYDRCLTAGREKKDNLGLAE